MAKTKSKGKKAADYAMWTIMLLLVLGLGGLGTRQFTQRAQTVGHVGDREITAQEYQRALDNTLKQYSQKLGTQLTLQQSQIFGVPQQALGQLVAQAALDNEDDLLGLSVGDARVAKEVEQIKGFEGPKGTFDAQVYRATLKRVGLTPQVFERQIRDEMTRTILRTAVASGIDAPKTATTAVLNYALTTRDLSVLKITPDQLDTPVPAPTEDELKAYFKDHAKEYTVPETRHITYISLTPEMLAKTIKVDDATLRADYKAQSDKYDLPERRVVERLVFVDKAAADKAAADIAAGTTTFEDLVKARGLTLSDVDLGKVTKKDLGPAGDAVFAVKDVGQTAEAPTALGTAIFRVNAILAPKTTPFDAVKADLAKEEALKQATNQVPDVGTKIDDMLASGATLEEVAKETPAELATIAWTGQENDGIGADPKFAKAAAAITTSDFPKIEDDSKNGVFAMRLDKIDPERPQTFDEAKAAVTKAWTEEKTAAALLAKADAEAKSIEGGADMAQAGGTFSTLSKQARNSVGEGLTPAALKTAFEMKKGEVRTVGDAKASYVLRVDALHAPDPNDKKVEAQRTALSNDLANSIGKDIVALYTNAVQTEAGVSLNQAVVNAVNASFR